MPHVPGLRSCYAKVGRLVYFGRMLDKIRLNAEGMLDCYLQAILSAAGVKATSGSRKAISPRARVA